MKRIAIISDLHADLHALQDAITQAERLGAHLILCAGDVVDLGVFPEETIRLLRERRIPTVKGNHDAWALAEGADASGWDLTAEAVRFLEALPAMLRFTVGGVRLVITHARPGSNMRGLYPETRDDELRRQLERADADALLCGHTHLPMERRVRGAGVVLNPGALLRDPAVPMHDVLLIGGGVPARGDGGTFGLLELPGLKFSVHRAVDGVEVVIEAVR